MIIRIIIPTDPVVASRARTTKTGRTFYQPKYQEYKTYLKTFFAANIDERCITSELVVEAEFVLKRPKKSKFTMPIGDIDNYLKSLDALEAAGIIDNDRQLVKVIATKRFCNENEAPHTKLLITDNLNYGSYVPPLSNSAYQHNYKTGEI